MVFGSGIWLCLFHNIVPEGFAWIFMRYPVCGSHVCEYGTRKKVPVQTQRCDALICYEFNGFSSSSIPWRDLRTWCQQRLEYCIITVSYTHLRTHETRHDIVCR